MRICVRGFDEEGLVRDIMTSQWVRGAIASRKEDRNRLGWSNEFGAEQKDKNVLVISTFSQVLLF